MLAEGATTKTAAHPSVCPVYVHLHLWKMELQRLADATGLFLKIRYFPPGTSKWNKVKHRLFSFISSNWHGGLQGNYETVVRLIASTNTAMGLTVICHLDRRHYPVGRKSQ